jgi:hypothetical protein
MSMMGIVGGDAKRSVSYPLDGLTTTPLGAFGLRRLATSYTGPLIQVRRSSDNTTADIGYTSTGDLDTAALLAFVGAGDGYISKRYKQVGSANDATSPATGNQPQIVASGALRTIGANSRPAAYGVDNSRGMFAGMGSGNVSVFGLITVCQLPATGNAVRFGGMVREGSPKSDQNGSVLLFQDASTGKWRNRKGTTGTADRCVLDSTVGQPAQAYSYFDATEGKITVDGVSSAAVAVRRTSTASTSAWTGCLALMLPPPLFRRVCTRVSTSLMPAPCPQQATRPQSAPTRLPTSAPVGTASTSATPTSSGCALQPARRCSNRWSQVWVVIGSAVCGARVFDRRHEELARLGRGRSHDVGMWPNAQAVAHVRP